MRRVDERRVIRDARNRGDQAFPVKPHANTSLHGIAQVRVVKTGKKYDVAHPDKISPATVFKDIIEARQEIPSEELTFIGTLTERDSGKKRYFYVKK